MPNLFQILFWQPPFTKLNIFDHFLHLHLFVVLVNAYSEDSILKQKSKLINLIHPIFFMLTKTNPFFLFAYFFHVVLKHIGAQIFHCSWKTYLWSKTLKNWKAGQSPSPG